MERSTVKCSCDALCGFNGDCCDDFEHFCSQNFQDYLNLSELYARQDFECVYIPEKFTGTRARTTQPYIRSTDDIGYLMITKCYSDGSKCEYSRTPNIDANIFVPMYDLNRGVHYISGHCAMCNGAKNVTPWNVDLECYDVPELKEARVILNKVIRCEKYFFQTLSSQYLID